MNFYIQILISMLLAATTAAILSMIVFAVRPDWVNDLFIPVTAPVLYVLYFAAGSWLINRKEKGGGPT